MCTLYSCNNLAACFGGNYIPKKKENTQMYISYCVVVGFAQMSTNNVFEYDEKWLAIICPFQWPLWWYFCLLQSEKNLSIHNNQTVKVKC